jgi:hypothetical protein
MAIKYVFLSSCNQGFGIDVIIDDVFNQVQDGVTLYVSGCTKNDSQLISEVTINQQVNLNCFTDCFQVERIKDCELPCTETPNAIILNSYGVDNCTGCTLDNARYLVFSQCFNDFGQYYIDINDITPTPNINDVFFLDLILSFRGRTIRVNGCFYLFDYATSFDGGPRQGGIAGVLSYSAQTDCQTCFQTSPVIYLVSDCAAEQLYCVALPSTGYENHLITFTDVAGLTQYCGIVQEETKCEDIFGVLVSDLGVYNDLNNNCDICLSTVAEKKKLVNCISGNEVIVWASSLYEAGNSTHLTFGEGCYLVSPDVVPSATTVTINELADYAPQENCEDCLECYGLIYEYESCEPIEVCNVDTNIFTGGFNLYSINEMVIDPSNFLYVTFGDNGRIAKYNLNTQSYVSQSPVFGSNPFGIDIDFANNIICVSNSNSNYITFLDANNLNNYANITVPQFVGGRKVYFDSLSGLFYVTFNFCCFSQNIRVYSASTYNSVSFITTFGNTGQNYYDIIRIGSLIYTLNFSSLSMDIFDLSYNLITSFYIGSNLTSFDYDGINIIYIATTTNIYVKYNISLSSSTNVTYNRSCYGGSNVKIKLNVADDRIYITDKGCGDLYEFQLSTDTLLRTYNQTLDNEGIQQVYGIDVDSSGTTWFGAYSNIFTVGCTNQIVQGQTTSNEYLEIGDTFFNYQLSACCEITSVQSIVETKFSNITEYISMVHYQDCPSCLAVTHQLFSCSECSSGVFAVLVAPSGLYNPGDFVRSHFGNSDWLCFQIDGVYDGQQFGLTTFEADGVIYGSCEECQSGATLGLTLINTETLTSGQYNVTLSDWLTITGFPFGVPNSCISDQNGVCYQVVNSCPIDNIHPLFVPLDYFTNQQFCRLAPRPSDVISAGTEYFACQVCCPCESGATVTRVSVPHPVWTGLYGNSIILLDAVKLGGETGLNS